MFSACLLPVSWSRFFIWLLNAKGYFDDGPAAVLGDSGSVHRRVAFWSAFEQAGSTLNLFAERNTNLHAWDFPLGSVSRQLLSIV